MMNNDGWWKKITLIGLSYLFFITKAKSSKKKKKKKT